MTKSNPPVMVTGGAGYIGGHTVLALLDAGFPVVVIDDLSAGRRQPFHDRTMFFEGSIENESLIRAVMEMHRVDTVIHCAGSNDASDGPSDPMRFYRNNTSATRSLVESAVACGIANFILSSSTSVYGRPATLPVTEKAEPKAQTAFAKSMLMAEQMLADTARVHAFNSCIIRSSVVAGADPALRAGPRDGSASGTVGAALDVIFGLRGSVTIGTCPGATPDGTVVHDYVHVSDLAAANVAALKRLQPGSAKHLVLNCSYNGGYSDKAVIDTLERIFNMLIKHRQIPLSADQLPALVTDNSAILAELDWTPQHNDLETLIRDHLRWELHRPRPTLVGSETIWTRAAAPARWTESPRRTVLSSSPALPLARSDPDGPGRERKHGSERQAQVSWEAPARQGQQRGRAEPNERRVDQNPRQPRPA